MSDTSRAAASRVIPALRYDDAPAAIRWLTGTMGFAEHFVVPGEAGTIAHAQITHGGGMVMLGSAGNAKPSSPWGKVRMGLYVVVDDIDAHYARAVAAGADIAGPLHDTDYGSREYWVRDPEGNLWSFGTYDPWATPA